MTDTINEVPVTETKTDTQPPIIQTSTEGPSMNTPATPKPPSMRQIKAATKQQKKIGKYIRSMRKNQYKANGKISKELTALKAVIGYDDFEAIVAVATSFHPEKKDDTGKVTQEAYNQTNWQAVIAEAKNLLVLRREKRMKANSDGLSGTKDENGKLVKTRKRTSGRSSHRKAHRAKYAFIVKRGKETLENQEPVVGTLKV